MTWFKVDDTLATHTKARVAGLPAMGLWVVSGSFSSQQLTDGLVPEWYVKTWPGAIRHAARLVDAGLWEPIPGGWHFHQWEQSNPTREQVEAEREKARIRQQEWRDKHARNAVTNGVTNGAPTRPDPTRPVLVVPRDEDVDVDVARRRAR